MRQVADRDSMASLHATEFSIATSAVRFVVAFRSEAVIETPPTSRRGFNGFCATS